MRIIKCFLVLLSNIICLIHSRNKTAYEFFYSFIKFAFIKDNDNKNKIDSLIKEKNQKLGKKILDDFYFDKNFTNVNHGSYGLSPIVVMNKYQEYQRELEFNPEKFIRFESFNRTNEILELISHYINADSKDIVFVENASDAVNSVLKSIFAKNSQDQEKILSFDITYSMTKAVIQYLENDFNVKNVIFQVTDQIINSKLVDLNANKVGINFNENTKIDKKKHILFDKELFLRKYEETIVENLPIKAAIIDHISSVPGLIFPVKELIIILRRYNIISVIDGAHVIGHIDLNIKDLEPDYYLSNFHKWFFVPKAACLLYINPSFQNITHPNIINENYRAGIKKEFSSTGTRDISCFLSVKDALQYRNKYGDKEIKTFSRELAYEAGLKISEIWKTEMLTYDRNLLANLVNVEIPCKEKNHEYLSVDFIKDVVYETMKTYNVFIATFKFSNGKYYARFSANIYNEISDYVYAAEKFLMVLREKESKLGENFVNPKF